MPESVFEKAFESVFVSAAATVSGPVFVLRICFEAKAVCLNARGFIIQNARAVYA